MVKNYIAIKNQAKISYILNYSCYIKVVWAGFFLTENVKYICTESLPSHQSVKSSNGIT